MTLEYKVTLQCETCPYIETHGDSYATEQEAETICEQMNAVHAYTHKCSNGASYVWPRLKERKEYD